MVKNPMTAINDLSKRNLDLWRKMQDDFFRSTGAPATNRSPQDPED